MAAQADSDDALTGAEETDAGPPRAGKPGVVQSEKNGPDRRDPERRCIVTMQRRPHSEMIRFVLSPEGQVTPDVAARLPGRGAWVSATREAVDQAAGRGAFARAFKRQVAVPADLGGQTEALLVRRCMDMLGMARRAGNLVAGFEQVREALRDARPGCLITASDGSEDQRNKVLGLAKAIYGPDLDAEPQNAGNGRLRPVAECFLGSELGMALGRDRVIHACLKLGPIAHAWMGELGRLSGFRRVWLPGWQPTTGFETGSRGEN